MTEKNIEQIEQLVEILNTEIKEFKKENSTVHPYDISEQLLKLRDLDEDEYSKILKRIPSLLLAEVLSEMPDIVQEEISE